MTESLVVVLFVSLSFGVSRTLACVSAIVVTTQQHTGPHTPGGTSSSVLPVRGAPLLTMPPLHKALDCSSAARAAHCAIAAANRPAFVR